MGFSAQKPGKSQVNQVELVTQASPHRYLALSLQLGFSKLGSNTNSCTWKPVGNANPWVPTQANRIKISGDEALRSSF